MDLRVRKLWGQSLLPSVALGMLLSGSEPQFPICATEYTHSRGALRMKTKVCGAPGPVSGVQCDLTK